MSTLQSLSALEVLDSRGFPTVHVTLTLASGAKGAAMVPSGASTGTLEAIELRDKDANRYMGKGVQKAIQGIYKAIAPALVNKNFASQCDFDEQLIKLDGSENKATLGANAILACSLAFACAQANEQQQPLYQFLASNQDTLTLPMPMMNIINGGAHADNQVDIQEFMILPAKAPSFSEAVRMGVEVYHALKGVLKSRHLNTNVGDEGGFAPNLSSNQEALDLIMAAIEKAGFKAGEEIFLGLDIAASEFYQDKHYHLAAEKRILSPADWIKTLQAWVKQYPILSIEDAMAENDWAGWHSLTEALGKKVQLVGDDLFVTNTHLLQRGIKEKSANAILIKPNQIGTLTETLSAITKAQAAGFGTIISHRSGETEDTFIADLSVATRAGQIKTGAPCRSDRNAKYNRLLMIAAESHAAYAGPDFLRKWG